MERRSRAGLPASGPWRQRGRRLALRGQSRPDVGVVGAGAVLVRARGDPACTAGPARASRSCVRGGCRRHPVGQRLDERALRSARRQRRGRALADVRRGERAGALRGSVRRAVARLRRRRSVPSREREDPANVYERRRAGRWRRQQHPRRPGWRTVGGDRGRAEPNRGRARRHAGRAQRAAVRRRQVVHRRRHGRPVAANELRAGPRRTRGAGRVGLGPGVRCRPRRLRRDRRRAGLRRSRVLRSEGDQGRRRTPVVRRLRRRGHRRSPGAAVEPGSAAGAHRADRRRRRDPCAAGSRAPACPCARRQHRVHGAEPRRAREGGVPLPAGGEGRGLGRGRKPATGVLHRSPARGLSVPGDRRQRSGALERGRRGLGVLDRARLLPDQRVQAGRRRERRASSWA